MKNIGLNRYKRLFLLSLVLVIALAFSACGKKQSGGRGEKKSDVEQLLDEAKSEETTTEQTTELTTQATTEDTAYDLPTTQALDGTNGQYAPNMSSGEITTEYPLATGPSQMDGSGAYNPEHKGGEYEEEDPIGEADSNVDVDLTVLTPNMVYAEVSNMMMYPDNYLGKTIKVSGPYFPMYYDVTDNYYHYVLIEDALACCQNGMEFIWEEGIHTYPEEYPKEEDVIEIIGELKSYKEEGYTYYYLDIDTYEVLEEN